MKTLQLTLLLLICATAGMGQQLLLTGTIKGAATPDPVEVNVPYDGIYWKNNSVYLKPNAAGTFHIALPYQTPKFIMVLYKEYKQWVLLSPGRPLHVTINATKPTPVFGFTGIARAENELVQKLQLDDENPLAFIKEAKAKNSYAGWSIDSIIRIKLPQIKHSLDSTQRLVSQCALPLSVKKTIAAEVKYAYANAVSQSLAKLLNTRKNRADFNLYYIDAALTTFGMPSKTELDAGINANSYLEAYFRMTLWKAMYVYGITGDKDYADKILKASVGFSMKDVMSDPDRGSEQYYFTTHMKIKVPPYAYEKNLANLMHNFCQSGQLQEAAKLLHFIRLNCTDTQYIAACEKMFAPLKKSRDQYAGNLNIKIRPDYRNISSVSALLAPYKGKIVFVDMWYTQCPPCRVDLAFEPQLKSRLKDKDVVFLYIAKEEDKDDEIWRDFIFINNLTGEHIRRTASQVPPLWNQLGVIDSEQAYPHYFIFDREGKIMVQDAKRPSDGDALYNQLELALSK